MPFNIPLAMYALVRTETAIMNCTSIFNPTLNSILKKKSLKLSFIIRIYSCENETCEWSGLSRLSKTFDNLDKSIPWTSCALPRRERTCFAWTWSTDRPDSATGRYSQIPFEKISPLLEKT